MTQFAYSLIFQCLEEKNVNTVLACDFILTKKSKQLNNYESELQNHKIGLKQDSKITVLN